MFHGRTTILHTGKQLDSLTILVAGLSPVGDELQLTGTVVWHTGAEPGAHFGVEFGSMNDALIELMERLFIAKSAEPAS